MKIIVLIVSLLLSLSFGEDKLPNDIRWVTGSDEYKSLCEQTYHLAWQEVKESVDNINGNLAIVMDLDETVMDNSQYQVEITGKGESFSMDSWTAWVNRGEAGLVPGVGAFIDSVRSLGNVRIVFISNRMADRTDVTRKNLQDLSAAGKSDIYLLRKDRGDKKNIRRKEIFTGNGRMEGYGSYTVIAWFGDAMGDFPSEIMDSKFGESWFMLPNPMYGKW